MVQTGELRDFWAMKRPFIRVSIHFLHQGLGCAGSRLSIVLQTSPLSPQQHFPAPPGGPPASPRPEEICNPSREDLPQGLLTVGHARKTSK